MMRVVGIDPGLEGGIALLSWGTPEAVAKMPLIQKEIDVVALSGILKSWCPDVVAIERAQAMPRQGVVSMFNYGIGYGAVLATLQLLKLPYRTVPPKTWQAWAYKRVRPRGNDPKEIALNIVRSLYPSAEIVFPKARMPHKGVVDALLIAGYADHVGK